MRLVLLRLVLLCSVAWLACSAGEVDLNETENGRLVGNVTVTGEPQCPDCTIALEEVAVLGDSSDDASVREDAMVWGCMVGQLSTGEFVMSGAIGGGSLFVYGDGGGVRRTIGRQGAGPGEFGRRMRMVVGEGDTIHVVDDSHLRVQTFTSSGEYVRSFRIPGIPGRFALLAGGNFMLHRKLTGQGDDDGYLFYMVDPAGEVLARFGKPTRELIEKDQWLASPSNNGGFWTASMWKYEFIHRTLVDSIDLTVTRDVSWFPPDGKWDDEMYVTVPPPANLVHMWEDDLGRLWTYTAIPDEEWELASEQRQGMPEWATNTFDIMIEVIDLREGRLIAQHRHDRWVGPVCGSNLMYTVVRAESGDTRVHVFRPTLMGTLD